MSKCCEFVPCQPFRNPSRVRIRRQNVLASPDVGFQISFFCFKNVQLRLLLCWCRQGQICSWGSCKVMAVPIRHKMLLHLNPDLSKDWALCKGSSRVVPTLQFRCIVILLEQKMCSPVCCPSYKVVGTDLPFSLRQTEPLVCPGLSLAIFHLQFLFQRDFVICFFSLVLAHSCWSPSDCWQSGIGEDICGCALQWWLGPHSPAHLALPAHVGWLLPNYQGLWSASGEGVAELRPQISAGESLARGRHWTESYCPSWRISEEFSLSCEKFPSWTRRSEVNADVTVFCL